MWEKAVKLIKKGEIAFIPTDTIYGIVGSALNKNAVRNIYKIRGRNLKKPCIVLCSSIADLPKLGINIDASADKKLLLKIWPNSVSVILPCTAEQMKYLHRGMKTLAFRIPKNKLLRNFIKKTGPIIAPSANPEGKPPAKNIKEAKGYFGNKVGVYVKGKVGGKPSTIVSLTGGKIKILRKGAWKVPRKLLFGVQ